MEYAKRSQNGDVQDPAKGGSDFWAVRLDENGSKLWDKRLGGDRWDYGANAILTDDGGFVLSNISQDGANGDKSEPARGDSDISSINNYANGNRNHHATDPEGD